MSDDASNQEFEGQKPPEQHEHSIVHNDSSAPKVDVAALERQERKMAEEEERRVRALLNARIYHDTGIRTSQGLKVEELDSGTNAELNEAYQKQYNRAWPGTEDF